MSDSPLFSDFDLPATLLHTIDTLGYRQPTPIQRETIPALLKGTDMLGQAQTGTGKTAAFALPMLARLDPQIRRTQVLVLAPTRELANQVADSFRQYAAGIRGVRVATLCGGQPYRTQLDSLRAGAQVVVGTPGRIMDHMRRNSLQLEALSTLVLDEADEMLRMGFIDDVEWILEHSPSGRQLALFSATMPDPIRRIASMHLVDPCIVSIQTKTRTAEGIRQRAVHTPSMAIKNEALTRLFETEQVDGAIVFVRTKSSTVEVGDLLQSRGMRVAALSGDIDQNLRERTVEQLKSGKIDIIVATDIAARGLDVERISHVINYDAPSQVETYIHRIGRTGRAGREGDAILFVATREKRLVRSLERTTRQRIEWMEVPSAREINNARIERFKSNLLNIAAGGDTSFFKQLIEELCVEHGLDPLDAAAALATRVQGDRPFLTDDLPAARSKRSHAAGCRQPTGRFETRHTERHSVDNGKRRKPERTPKQVTETLKTYRIEVGSMHKVKPKNIVGAIANEAGLSSRFIGRIAINHDHSLIDLPGGMPKTILRHLKKVRVAGQQIDISLATA